MIPIVEYGGMPMSAAPIVTAIKTNAERGMRNANRGLETSALTQHSAFRIPHLKTS
jgi:hypothetical protein